MSPLRLKSHPQLEDEDAFKTKFKGIPGHHVANALSSLTPGINWTGCGKGHMAEAWAEARHNHSHHTHSLRTISLDLLYAAVQRELHPKVPRG